MEEDISDFSLEGVVDADAEENGTSVLEQTIATMEESQLCFHPVHHHSFSPVNFLLSGSVRKCVGCEQHLKTVLGVSQHPHDQVVRCVSCGAYAHRSCAMDTPSRPQDFALMWNTKCPVNTVIIEGSALEGSPTVGEDENDEVLVTAEGDTKDETEKDDDGGILIPLLEDQLDGDATDEQQSSSSLFQFLSAPSNLLFAGSQHQKQESDQAPKELTVSSDEEEEDEEIMLWTSEGPPRHWANEQALSGIHRSTSADEAENDDEEEDDAKTPLHVANNTFSTVARALQENIVAHFIRRPFIEKVISVDGSDAGSSGDLQSPQARVRKSAPNIERTHTADSAVSRADVEALLTEVEPSSPKRSTIGRVASGTVEAAKTSAAVRKKMGIVSVAGGIAGGVAGLCVAGPAGAVIGAKCGQTAGLLGVLLEGSMTVGVFVAGVAAGSFTAQHIQQQNEKRVLTIGEDGVKQKLLLVRPNVSIDPVWEDICEMARRSHASSSLVFGILPSSQGKMSKKERYKRDSDIVETDESEIPTADKVLLLVSRSLNNKQGLPGHVYRQLIQDYRDRCEAREMARNAKDKVDDGGEIRTEKTETVVETRSEEMEPGLSGSESSETTHEAVPLVESPDGTTENVEDHTDDNDQEGRARRQDTHAVIKHVTATLLEVRPGFAASPAVTEMSATAVEGLVFGELYDSVFEEIMEETRECDRALMNKIRSFDEAHESGPKGDECSSSLISPAAVRALLMLPEAHSAADKLRYCVEFLELISVHFTETTKRLSNGKPSSLSADSLLKMVCQNIIAAKVPNINAEILFLEEFARDEQLLRGKEGYALVTLQASLHFLNTSTNFDEDIFGQDEEE
jgi:hypothetical protein